MLLRESAEVEAQIRGPRTRRRRRRRRGRRRIRDRIFSSCIVAGAAGGSCRNLVVPDGRVAVGRWHGEVELLRDGFFILDGFYFGNCAAKTMMQG